LVFFRLEDFIPVVFPLRDAGRQEKTLKTQKSIRFIARLKSNKYFCGKNVQTIFETVKTMI